MRMKTVPLHDAAPTTSAAAHLGHEANQPYLWCATCHPCSWATVMTVCLPFFASRFLACLLAHIPSCTTPWQPALLAPPLPLHLLAGTVTKWREAAVTLSQVRCFSEPQFPPCKMQAIFTTPVKHLKVFWWKMPHNTQASQLISPQPHGRAASRHHQGSPLSLKWVLLFGKQLS